MSDWTVGSSNLRPIKRLASKIVFSAFRAAWFLAAVPTNRSVSEKETYDGVVRSPMSLGIISTVLFFHVPTHEYVVPKSIPHDGSFFAIISYSSSYNTQIRYTQTTIVLVALVVA